MDKFADLQAFVAVVNAKSFSAAAERLDTAKSALSRRISALEQRLGTKLLHRTTRKLSLTDAGRTLYERATRLLVDLDEAEQAVRDEHAELRGRIKVAVPVTFGVRHLAPAIAEFMRIHRDLQIELDLNDRQVDLVEEGLDMAVRIGELADSSLIARRLSRIQRVAVASPGYLTEHGTPTHPLELADHIGLHYSNVSHREAWCFHDKQRREWVPDLTIRLRANNGDLLLAAAEAGLGVLVTPTFIAHTAIEQKRLVPILSDFQLSDVGLHLVYTPGRQLSQRVRVLAEFLAERFEEKPYWETWLNGQ
jgi:DNA-binding transcriptional LysR family regulator